MPLFEVEGDRPQLVSGPGSDVGTTAHRVVESHIDGLLGEQVFPVAPGTGPHEPHLLALDASGAPVVVELIARLDGAALSRALDHAGAAGRMTRGQLASLYRTGPQAFHRDIASFYDSVPVRRSQPGRASVRLIVICQDADADVLNAVDFLRQPAMPVEVLRLRLVHGSDGRRFVDVSPLVIHPASTPDRPELVAPPEEVAPVATPTGQTSPDGPGEVATSPGAPVAVVTPLDDPSLLPSATDGESLHRATAPATDDEPAHHRPEPAWAGAPERPQPAPALDGEPVPGALDQPALAWAVTSSDRVPERHRVRRRSRTDRFSAPPVPSDVEATALEVTASLPPVEPPRFPRDFDAGPLPDPTPWEPPFEPPRLEPLAPSPWWEAEQRTSSISIVLDEDADPDLAALAGALGEATALVWERPRRRQRFEALLHPDGTIELHDGSSHRHPDSAASGASGSYTADGWTVWRLAGTGQSLAEEFRARFA